MKNFLIIWVHIYIKDWAWASRSNERPTGGQTSRLYLNSALKIARSTTRIVASSSGPKVFTSFPLEWADASGQLPATWLAA